MLVPRLSANARLPSRGARLLRPSASVSSRLADAPLRLRLLPPRERLRLSISPS